MNPTTKRPVTADRIRAARLDTTCVRFDWPAIMAKVEAVDFDDATIEHVQAQGLRLRAALAACAGVEAVAS